MSPTEFQAHSLHAAFQRLTGQRITLSYQRQQSWTQFLSREFTEQDLELIIRWIKQQIARNEGGFSPLSLQFGALLGDIDKFEDRLNIARQSAIGKRAAVRQSDNRTIGRGDNPAMDPEEESRIRADAAKALSEFRRKMTSRE